MQVIECWIIKLLKTLCFCTGSLEINQWHVHYFTPVYKASKMIYLWSKQPPWYISADKYKQTLEEPDILNVLTLMSCHCNYYVTDPLFKLMRNYKIVMDVF